MSMEDRNVSTDMVQIPSKFDHRLSVYRPNTARWDDMANLQENLRTTERLLSKWDINTTSKMLLQSSPDEVRTYMGTVDNLHRLMQHLSSGVSNSRELIRPQRLMKTSTTRLEKEFHEFLISNSQPIHPDHWAFQFSKEECDSITDTTSRFSSCVQDGSNHSSSDSPSKDRISQFDIVALDTVVDLRNIAQCMANCGYGTECVRVFALRRKSVVEENLYNLGVEKVRLKDVRNMNWQLLEEKIKRWIYPAKISIGVLFVREKRLCDEVYEGLDKMKEFCFAEIAKESTARLLYFAEAVAASSRGPEKIFRVLDINETVADLMPVLEATYSQGLCRRVQDQANLVLVQLGDAVLMILKEFELAVEKDNFKAPISGGTVHPLTIYVMNYLAFLSDYTKTLINLMSDTPVKLPKVLPDDDLYGSSVPLSIHFGWNAFLLLCKLEAKADLYKDMALSHLTLMNNLHYITKKVKGSDIIYVLGQEWLSKQSNKVRQSVENYERAAWTQVLFNLRDEGIHIWGSYSGSRRARKNEAVKIRLKGFSLAMEEVMKRHDGWVVLDAGLREKVELSITQKLIPAYTSFITRF